MTPKQRVRCTLSHEVPDRVPTALWGSYYTLNDDTYFKVLDHLGLGDPVPPFRRQKPRNSNYYDDRVLDALETDVRYIWSGFTDLGGARMNGDCRDAWGVEWRRSGPHITSVNPPLAGLSIDEIDAHGWPDPERYVDRALMRDRVAHLKHDYPDHAVGARAVNSYGPFEQAAVMRGREDFYVELISDPDLCRHILERVTDVIVRGQEIYLEEVGGHIDFFEIPGDDYGGMEDLMISPEHFRAFFKPELKRIVEGVKAYRPDLPVVFHTDGAIRRIVPDFVDIGIDVLNPLEPLPATDWKAIKGEFGDRLCFMGGVDVRGAMTGSIEDVERDVARCVETFADGGGYILTSANHMQGDVPPENIVQMYESARSLGRYSSS